ncbi:endonuclease/exonuclease/phosphatase family protein [Streptomyces sp. NPDC050560]|uniref:endonuclease/exonuclease/phosphatase family protein n=1 Tax=Streptomyces sp. NPDC050560 TaxID=3365630 RepID=UPI0037AAE1ED
MVQDDDTADGYGRAGGAGRGASRVLAALPLLAVSAVVACRAADTDAFTPVPQLLACWPWLLAPAGLGLLVAALARWRLGLLWGVLLLAVLAWYVEPYGKVSEARGAPVAALRVVTANLQAGRAAADLARLVRSDHPDLVFVEECDRACADRLDEALGDDRLPHRAAAGDDGRASHGSLILSSLRLTAARGVGGTLGMPGAVADVRGHPVRLQLAHPVPPLPPHGVGVWRRDLGALRDWAAAADGQSTVLAGDFNASQDHSAFRHVLDTGLRDAARLAGHPRTPSWPARTAPALGAQIDHVLLSDDFSVRGARFVGLGGSDHRALVADVTLRSGGAAD